MMAARMMMNGQTMCIEQLSFWDGMHRGRCLVPHCVLKGTQHNGLSRCQKRKGKG